MVLKTYLHELEASKRRASAGYRKRAALVDESTAFSLLVQYTTWMASPSAGSKRTPSSRSLTTMTVWGVSLSASSVSVVDAQSRVSFDRFSKRKSAAANAPRASASRRPVER